MGHVRLYGTRLDVMANDMDFAPAGMVAVAGTCAYDDWEASKILEPPVAAGALIETVPVIDDCALTLAELKVIPLRVGAWTTKLVL